MESEKSSNKLAMWFFLAVTHIAAAVGFHAMHDVYVANQREDYLVNKGQSRDALREASQSLKSSMPGLNNRESYLFMALWVAQGWPVSLLADEAPAAFAGAEKSGWR